MQLGLKGKVVLVTGGTKGIGLGIVQAFLQEGAIVHFCSRTASDVESTAQTFTKNFGNSKAVGAVVDVSQTEELSSWVKSAAEQHGGQLDVIVPNVSALAVPNTLENWHAEFQTDMMGTYTMIEAALPYLEKARGNIVAISSVTGRYADFTAPSPYGAMKAAIIHYISQLAHTLAPKGVRANTVSPGNTYFRDGFWGNTERDNPEFFKQQLAENPMGRMASPEDVANAVLFLASGKASFVSGANLNVDGALCSAVQF